MTLVTEVQKDLVYLCRMKEPMLHLDPKELPVPKRHQYLLSAVGPRPVCFASTVDAEGRRNLSPFSFFNVFSANPPILVFSPARSGRTGATKDTYENVKEVPEVVINVVNYDMVYQMSLASSPYERGVDEFIKAGFTPVASDLVQPYRVAESPVQMECKVIEVKELGQEGGAGNLIICEVIRIHIKETVLNEHQMIDQEKIDLVARMGGNWYCRAHGTALFEIDKPITTLSLGVDSLPDHIRLSDQLTGNELGQLANLESFPDAEEIRETLLKLGEFSDSFEKAKELIAADRTREAMCVLLSAK